MPDLERYIKRHHIEVEHILSVYCYKRHTMICFDSGEEFASSLRLYDLMEILPEEEFITICRGTIVRRSAIFSISDDGVYTMIDGRTFQGRKRYLSTHKKLRNELGLKASKTLPGNVWEVPQVPLKLMEKCRVLDDMPVAYCVIELVFDENGHGIDFIFRYCNQEMEAVEGVPIEDMIDHSFYEVFKNGDRKWLVTYADVALNGVKRTLHDYSPEINRNLTIHCYQPEPGYCACLLIPDVEEP